MSKTRMKFITFFTTATNYGQRVPCLLPLLWVRATVKSPGVTDNLWPLDSASRNTVGTSINNITLLL